MDIKFNKSLPIYLQIVDWIKQQISTSKIKKGEKLYSIRDLSKKINVNPNTIQRVYKELESENIIYSKRGMGMFVTDSEKTINEMKLALAKSVMDEFITKMNSMGYKGKDLIFFLDEYINKKGE